MSFTLWFTGMSGSGKTTLSKRVYEELSHRNVSVELLDGDIIRTMFSQELGFSRAHRDINVRRLGFISHLLNKHNIVSLVAAISPYAATRLQNREFLVQYHEVFCKCPLEILEQRDVKGLYKKARAGEIQNFTGISDVYEEPESPEIIVSTDIEAIDESLDKIVSYLESKSIIPLRTDVRR